MPEGCPGLVEPAPGILPDAVCIGLRCAHGDDAGAEALLRAFLAERHGDRDAARFWIAAYGRLVSALP